MEEHELVLMLLHEHLHVGDPGQPLERRQLQVVGGEERAAADAALQVLDNGLRDRQAIVGARAAAHFVEDHEALRRSAIEDPRGLRHLHQKRARTPREVVAGPDPREQPVDDTDAGPLRGHEAASLGHHGHQRCLADERALAAHVGPGDEQDRRRGPTPGGEAEIVGDERAGREEFLEHRMTARVDHELAPCGDLWPHPAAGPGHLGEGEEHVEHGEYLGRPIEPAPLAGHEGPQLIEQTDLAADALFLRAEHLPLPLVELGGRVSLGVLDRLLADVLGGRLVCVGAADLQEEAKHAVVAHLERADARPLDLLCLVAGDPCLAAAGEFDEFVERCVEAGADETAVAGVDRAALAKRRASSGCNVGAGIEAVAEVGEQAASATKRGHDVGKDGRGPANPFEVARTGAAGHHAAHQSLEVADAGEPLGEPAGERGIGNERCHGVEAVVDRGPVDERRREPFAEQPRPHR